MRWTVKVVVPSDDPERPTVEWEFDTTRVRARNRAELRQTAAQLPVGTRVNVHRCYNDEPDATRQRCVVTDAWEKTASGWARTV